MINSRDFEQLLFTFTDLAESNIDQRFRQLRAAGLVPKGANGRNAPPISARQAAVILIGVASVARPGQIPARVPQFLCLPAAEPDKSGFNGHRTFVEAFTYILDTPSLWPGRRSGIKTRVDRVEIAREVPEAVIYWDDERGNEVPYRYTAAPEERHPIRLSVAIRASALSMIALNLKEDVRRGWVGVS